MSNIWTLFVTYNYFCGCSILFPVSSWWLKRILPSILIVKISKPNMDHLLQPIHLPSHPPTVTLPWTVSLCPVPPLCNTPPMDVQSKLKLTCQFSLTIISSHFGFGSKTCLLFMKLLLSWTWKNPWPQASSCQEKEKVLEMLKVCLYFDILKH